jgi:colanic acid biosynthesis glycosyl transferase WcaI
MTSPLKLTIISQVYPPDPAAVGQHLADVAEAMVGNGWCVTVYTSRCGYDDPATKYQWFERRAGVSVRRLPFSSFGKSSIAKRLLAQGLFMAQAVLLAAFGAHIGVVLVSTSPPFAGAGGAFVSLLRNVPLVWWVMDINPDQLIATGATRRDAMIVRFFDALNRLTLRTATRVVVLDRFMKDRILDKGAEPATIEIVPPWSHQQSVSDVPRDRNVFRRQHGLGLRRVVMYSGNHGFNPLDTLLEAAEQYRDDERLAFAFIGGGTHKKAIDARVAKGDWPNLLSLPYQPIEGTRDSLSAADVHVVSVAPAGVGIVHPSKIYSALAIGRPILLLAPVSSPAAEILAEADIGWRVDHGDVVEMRRVLDIIASEPAASLGKMGARALMLADKKFSRQSSIAAVCRTIEAARKTRWSKPNDLRGKSAI